MPAKRLAWEKGRAHQITEKCVQDAAIILLLRISSCHPPCCNSPYGYSFSHRLEQPLFRGHYLAQTLQPHCVAFCLETRSAVSPITGCLTAGSFLTGACPTQLLSVAVDSVPATCFVFWANFPRNFAPTTNTRHTTSQSVACHATRSCSDCRSHSERRLCVSRSAF